jgi:hypothetical protein
MEDLREARNGHPLQWWDTDEMNDHTETLLEIAQRHVREGEERLARQAEIVAQLKRMNDPAAAALANTVLDTIRSSLTLMKGHLSDIERQSQHSGPARIVG